MAVHVRISGVDKLSAVSRAMRRVGSTGLRQELHRGISNASKPLVATAKGAPMDRPGLPSSGGLAGTVASGLRRGVRTRRRLSGRNPSISISGKWSGHDVSALNRGRLRHPLFGNRRFWYTQSITPGFWDKPLEREAPTARKEIDKVLNDIARKIARSV